MNVLVVTAHFDDLELGCGGTVARLVEAGHRVIALVITHSGYSDPWGKEIRNTGDARLEGAQAAEVLGYELINFEEPTQDMAVNDSNASRILDVLTRKKIDTLLTHWSGDTSFIHQRVATMALQVSRRVSRILAFTVNWYIGPAAFQPTTYVALEERHWELKIRALSCHKTEFKRAGSSWVDYLDRQTRNYGTQLGVHRAEGFVTIKNLWELPHASS